MERLRRFCKMLYIMHAMIQNSPQSCFGEDNKLQSKIQTGEILKLLSILQFKT